MRYAAILVVGLGIGFGVGWLAFDWPFGEAEKPSTSQVETEVAREVGRVTHKEIAAVDCHELASPADTWNCTPYHDVGASGIVRL